MSLFEIVAHRGSSVEYPENTLASFERAIELGADAIELDVRLTKDKIPVVYHYYYLQMITNLNGPIFDFTYEQLQSAKFTGTATPTTQNYSIPTFEEVLDSIGGQIGLEIEIKGPESESIEIISPILNRWKKHHWESFEITSFEPCLLRDIKNLCPGIITDLLTPKSDPWMDLDVVTHRAIHRGKLAGARAVHLHPTQLTAEVVEEIQTHGLEVHSWDINDPKSLELIADLGIPKFTTDNLQLALNFRNSQIL